MSAEDLETLKNIVRERKERGTSTAKNLQPDGTERMNTLTDGEIREELQRRELARQSSAVANPQAHDWYGGEVPK